MHYPLKNLAVPNNVTSNNVDTNSQGKTKTPMIAGSVCGGVIAIVWIMGFSLYFFNRYKRRNTKLASQLEAGNPNAGEKVSGNSPPDERVVVPPDPAVFLGYPLPGEQPLEDKHSLHEKSAPSSNLRPSPRVQPTITTEVMLVPPSKIV